MNIRRYANVRGLLPNRLVRIAVLTVWGLLLFTVPVFGSDISRISLFTPPVAYAEETVLGGEVPIPASTGGQTEGAETQDPLTAEQQELRHNELLEQTTLTEDRGDQPAPDDNQNAEQDISTLAQTFRTVIRTVLPLLIALATVVLMYGIFIRLTAAGDEQKMQKSRWLIMWSLIILFIMVSIWGFVVILINTFDLDTSAPQSDNLRFVPDAQ